VELFICNVISIFSTIQSTAYNLCTIVKKIVVQSRMIRGGSSQ